MSQFGVCAVMAQWQHQKLMSGSGIGLVQTSFWHFMFTYW